MRRCELTRLHPDLFDLQTSPPLRVTMGVLLLAPLLDGRFLSVGQRDVGDPAGQRRLGNGNEVHDVAIAQPARTKCPSEVASLRSRERDPGGGACNEIGGWGIHEGRGTKGG